jgi:hypothetical protein
MRVPEVIIISPALDPALHVLLTLLLLTSDSFKKAAKRKRWSYGWSH